MSHELTLSSVIDTKNNISYISLLKKDGKFSYSDFNSFAKECKLHVNKGESLIIFYHGTSLNFEFNKLLNFY
jgi:hypothetical protein